MSWVYNSSMSKESESQLSDEFKKDIKAPHKNSNFFGTLIALIAIVLVFGTVGIAGYQMLFRPESIETKSAEEKIESRPVEKTETKTETKVETKTETKTTTPVATAEKDTSYTVKSGDTWSSIANANGMSSTKLMEYNGTTSEDLQIGQTIKVPKS